MLGKDPTNLVKSEGSYQLLVCVGHAQNHSRSYINQQMEELRKNL